MEGDGKESWVVEPSERSLACYNPIRSLIEKQFLPALERCDKDVLKLATGKGVDVCTCMQCLVCL